MSIQVNDGIYFISRRVKLCFYLVLAEHGTLLLTIIPSNKLTASSCLSVHENTSLTLRLICQRRPLNQLWLWLTHFSFSLCDAFYFRFSAGFLRVDQKPGGFWKALATRSPVVLSWVFLCFKLSVNLTLVRLFVPVSKEAFYFRAGLKWDPCVWRRGAAVSSGVCRAVHLR